MISGEAAPLLSDPSASSGELSAAAEGAMKAGAANSCSSSARRKSWRSAFSDPASACAAWAAAYTKTNRSRKKYSRSPATQQRIDQIPQETRIQWQPLRNVLQAQSHDRDRPELTEIYQSFLDS